MEHGGRYGAEQRARDAAAATGAHEENVERLLAQQGEDLLGGVPVAKHGGHRQLLRKRRGDLAQVCGGLGLDLGLELPQRHAGGHHRAGRVWHDREQGQLRVLLDRVWDHVAQGEAGRRGLVERDEDPGVARPVEGHWLSLLLVDHRDTVRRFVNEAVNGGRDEVIDEVFAPELTAWVREWFGAFRRSFPDMQMELLELVADGNTVVGRFACSATHLGEWRGHPPTGRRFERVDEVYFFTFDGDRIAAVWGIEDTLDRFEQLGLPAGG
jgi:predicted ester cyclase